MPKPTKGGRLGAGPPHQRLMLSGLAADLFRQERIRTTETKAKRLRPVAERLITWGKSGTVHARRQALALIEDRDVVHKLFSDIAPRYTHRNGGYTRILKLGPRKGDAAMMALIELVEGEAEEEAPTAASRAPGEQKARRGRRLGRRRGPSVESAGSEEPAPEEASEPSVEALEATEVPEADAEPKPDQNS